ncbi:sigma 54-interacting transcriptional regulator [Bacillus sp. FJAT-47783]|uniref:sigma 54-interacting transcriptional regulator n=1 Tax=Bacillus sp. FJAT-47783 TaxID=2922712 RepID=UPI001FADE21E|nr:sigma 54-interacting transcriptional regulator [Bacillus sp. FJAT-47783]
MLHINDENIRPIMSVSFEESNETWKEQLNDYKEPFLFIEQQGELVSFVSLKKLMITNWNDPSIDKDQMIHSATSIRHVCQLNESLSLPDIFQIIGQEIAFVKDQSGEITGYIRREDILVELLKKEDKSVDILKIILTSIPMGMFIVDMNGIIINYNESGLKMIKAEADDILNVKADEIFNQDHIHQVFSTGETLLNQVIVTDEMGILVDYSPIVSFDQSVEGLIIIVQDLPMVEEMAMEIEYVKNLNKDLNAILSTIYDEILVVNNQGTLIRASETSIPNFWGVDNLHELVGENILELEKKGLFTPSITRLVIEQKKKVSTVQDTNNGRKVLAVGNPVFNEKGEIDRIIIASRDITETTQLKTELKEMKKLSDQYRRELESMKNKDLLAKKIIYSSPKMEKIMLQVAKVAEFSSTVLIHGESGVGKEVIAQAIHQSGLRASQPFLKLNCGAIPETLLESELFGYVKGAFTGADTGGKDGYFKRADKGMLFLDEIGEMSVTLQVKLLRVLQEREFVPVGSTTPICVDVQIIAATNKNLEEMVQKGTFREDLFYRLNVIPIHVPPLRERHEDIPLLAIHFLQQLNERYNRNFQLTPDALNLLEVYPWPGNIRELQNIIERLVVTAESDVIDGDFVSQFLHFGGTRTQSKPIITNIMPLNEAQELLEEQLISLAMKRYKTTTKAAKVLGISQSSVSRKYQKILSKNEETNVL